MKGETLTIYDPKTEHAIDSIIVASDAINNAEELKKIGAKAVGITRKDLDRGMIEGDEYTLLIMKGWIHGMLRQLIADSHPEIVKDFYASRLYPK